MTLLFLLFNTLCAGRFIADFSTKPTAFHESPILGTSTAAVLLLNFIVWGSGLYRSRHQPCQLSWLEILRLFLGLFVLFTIGFALLPLADADPIAERDWALGLLASLVGLLAWLANRHGFGRLLRKKPVAALEWVASQIAGTLLLLELSVFVWSHFSGSPIALDYSRTESQLKRYRRQPGELFFGFPMNSLGYHDAEFSQKDDGKFVVNLISDSFGFGIVPYAYNFTTVAETALSRWLSREAAINNMSVLSIGMPEYASLYLNEGSRFQADVVALCIFVGNDISGIRKVTAGRFWNFSDWGISKVVARLVRLYQERRRGAQVERIGKLAASPAGREELAFNPAVEVPSFSPEGFAAIEWERLRAVCEKSRRVDGDFQAFFEALRYFRNLVKEPLLVLVLPDVFQVNDAFYDQLLAGRDAARFDRFGPQERIAAFCRRERVEFLDLLPVLREGEKGGPCYSLRDTHWNARGNRVVGERLAEALKGFVRPKSK